MDKLTLTATLVRSHYIMHFRNEYEKLIEENVLKYTKGEHDTGSFLVLSDHESNLRRSRVKFTDIDHKLPSYKTRHYRHDFVTLHSNKVLDTHLCWPVMENYIEEKVEDDFPWFTSFKINILNTELVVNPFPWYNCVIDIYPYAEPVKGILDAWFYNWYFRRTLPDPFLGLIHNISGPFKEKEGYDSYMIDLGTAPIEAFTNLIYNLCRKQIRRIEIN